jgi:hypothetical protein
MWVITIFHGAYLLAITTMAIATIVDTDTALVVDIMDMGTVGIIMTSTITNTKSTIMIGVTTVTMIAMVTVIVIMIAVILIAIDVVMIHIETVIGAIVETEAAEIGIEVVTSYRKLLKFFLF